MSPDAFVLFASQGPFGPTYLTCLLLPLFLAAPFVLLAIIARSLLGSTPLPLWLLAVVVLGGVGASAIYWNGGFSQKLSGFWTAWLSAAAAAGLLSPLVLLREGGKRGWFDRRR